MHLTPAHPHPPPHPHHPLLVYNGTREVISNIKHAVITRMIFPLDLYLQGSPFPSLHLQRQLGGNHLVLEKYLQVHFTINTDSLSLSFPLSASFSVSFCLFVSRFLKIVLRSFRLTLRQREKRAIQHNYSSYCVV